MKTLKLIVIASALFLAGSIQAQVSVNVNIGSPPMWGPVGYSNVQYYYLPDVEAYYDVPSSMFIYQSGGVWIHRTYLPTQYRHYDLYNGYKVVMTDYHGNTPYTHYKEHKYKYAKGYRGPSQKNIGNRPEKEKIRSNVHSNVHNYNNESGQGNGRNQGNGKNHENGNNSRKSGNEHGNEHGKKK